MKTVRDVMTTNVVHVSPSNKVKTAIMLMKGHGIGGLPVVDNGTVVGVLDYHDLLGKDGDIPVEHVMHKEFAPVHPDMTIAEAADLMAKVGASRLLVMEDGALVGILTHGDLLPELGKSFDPITNLPRSDAMRDWGIAALKRGQEITVLFMDLDDFREFNKEYGHIIGDNVLKFVADTLKAHTNEETDFVCRYAGDEFVIVTLRNSEEAKQLAEILEKSVREGSIHNLPRQVTGSIGVHGGKRTKEREDVHYAATLDNLINLASRSCTLAKKEKIAVVSLNGAPPKIETPEPTAPSASPEVSKADKEVTAQPSQPPVLQGQRLRIHALNFSWEGSSLAVAEVQLACGDIVHSHSCRGFAHGRNALRLVADATAGAVCQFLPPGHGVVVDTINVIDGGVSEDIVLVTAIVVTPQGETKVSGSSIIKQDSYRAAAAALLDAVNRQIARMF